MLFLHLTLNFATIFANHSYFRPCTSYLEDLTKFITYHTFKMTQHMRTQNMPDFALCFNKNETIQ